MENEKQKRIKYFSMFTGVGGFELGIGEKGECVGFSEIDKYCNELLAKRFPKVKNYGDATKINPNELPDFNLLVGGFPCQSFSIAGKRKGFEDTRGTLFHEIVRILKVKRPKYLLLENVKGLLSHDRGRTFAIILASLSELGYVIQWVVLNSKFFGVPQNRERVFIIGSLRGETIPEILPFKTSDGDFDREVSYCLDSNYSKGTRNLNKKQRTMISDINQAQRVYGTNGNSIALKGLGGGQGAKTGLYAIDLYNKKMHSDRTPALTEPHHNTLRIVERFPLKYMNRNQKNIEGDYSFTIDSANTGGLKDGMKIRRLTPVECERLQGFPDNWTEGFSDTQRYKMMGNAVTINVVGAIASRLI